MIVTASKLAAVIGMTRQGVYAALAGVPPAQTEPVTAWRLADLPSGLRTPLATIVQRRCYRSVEHLLTDPPRRWQPPRPFTAMTETVQREAEQWRDALEQPLARQHTLPAAELSALATAECRRVFGREVSEKTWRAHFDLAVKRDNDFEQWARVDLFVPESAYAVAPPLRRPVLRLQGLHGDLNEVIAQLADKSRPTLDDRAFLWDAAFRHLETLCGAHAERRQQKEIKRSLVSFLHAAVPAMARTEAALSRLFNRKLTAWRVGGRTVSALADGRPLKSGRTGATLCAACQAKVTGAAVELDGNESQAWRRLQQAGQLCPACAGAWAFNPRRNKSYVPATVRAAITPDVETALAHRRGPKFARLAGPYIPRDWGDVAPGDFFSADDVTWNHVYKYRDEEGRWHFARGECLLMTDLRTGYPLGFELIAGKYNAHHIRTLLLHVHDQETALDGVAAKAGGLPHVGCYFENGVWAARLIEGPRPRGWQANPWRETELGLREHGLNLEVLHASPGNPRSKPIEGLIRILQERMRCEPGFVGFDERRDAREVIQDYLTRARRTGEDPENSLLTMEQWRNRVSAILQEFADDPQNGKMLPGVSPAEAWWNGIAGKPGVADKPLRHLPDNARFTLASHKRPVNVTAQGIRFRVGRRDYVFWGEALAPYINRQVLAFFNLECPELLTCANLDRTEYFNLKAISAPAMTASPRTLGDLRRERNAFMRPARTLFGTLPKPLAATITRDTSPDESTRALGDFINQSTAEHRDAAQTERRETRKVRQLAATLGAPLPTAPRNLKRVREGLDLEAEALAEIREMRNEP